MSVMTDIVEALLFASGSAISEKDLVDKVQGLTKNSLVAVKKDLAKKYPKDGSGVVFLEFNGKLQFSTNPKYGDAIAEILTPLKEKELTTNLLEVLSTIAYKQPITKLELEEMRGVLTRFLKNYGVNAMANLYENLCEGRKAVVTPIEVPDALYVEKWLEEHRGEQNPYPEQGKYETEQGEYVRSKSEKILADTFYKMKVPYRYEARLSLGPNCNAYPDFTCLNVRKRRTIYWEHLGLLNVDAYASKNYEKLALYEKNGILLGDTLMISFETEECPLNTAVLRKKIEAVLK